MNKTSSGDMKHFFNKSLQKLLRAMLHLFAVLFILWALPATPLLFRNVPAVVIRMFQIILIWLFIAGFFKRSCHTALLITGISLILYFITLTPYEQFRDVTFQRVFSVRPEIRYLEDRKFEVVNLRKNRYPENYDERGDYQDIFVNEVFDISDVQSVQFIEVYWDGMFYVAHNMLNFKFSDGRELTVSVEPRTPVGIDREPFTCICKQQELLFILSDPQDLLDLRSRIRGEDMYVFDTTFTPLECQSMLSGIISKTYDLYHEPQFYDLITANCITALLPYFRNARPELKWDIRVILNGFFDRLLFEQGILVHRSGESFESLKARSFIKGKSQGKL